MKMTARPVMKVTIVQKELVLNISAQQVITVKLDPESLLPVQEVHIILILELLV